MSEAIKGQDKLKLALVQLEAEIFKDWPTKTIFVQHSNGIRINSSYNITINNLTIKETYHEGFRVNNQTTTGWNNEKI